MKTIAIIGGGPAGAMAAERLASGANLRVILFEEKLGWEKPCGGGLPYKALERYPFLLQASDPHTSPRNLELVAANGESVRLRLRRPLVIYSRATLNALLLAGARNAGAEIVQDRIVDFTRNRTGWSLAGRSGIYRAEYLVLAAGARSRLRRRLVPDFSARDFMLTFGYYSPMTDDLPRVQFFDDFEGYAWSFPRVDHLSVGICGKVGENKMSEVRDRLHAFMELFGYKRTCDETAVPPAIFSHLLPALTAESWHNLRLAGSDWALAGDAAGLVDPVTGEGIYFAMRSGELLAESLLEGAPEKYPERVWDDFGKRLALGSRLARPFYQGDFLGELSTTRLVQFANRSSGFMHVLQNLIDGSQSYSGLALRLYKTLGKGMLDLLAAAIRNELSPAGSG